MMYLPGHMIRVKCGKTRYKAKVLKVKDKQIKIKYYGDQNKYWITINRNVQHILDDETDKPKFIKKMRKVKTQNPGDQKMHLPKSFEISSKAMSFRDIYEHIPKFTEWLFDIRKREPIESKDFRRYLKYVKLCEGNHVQ